MESHEEPETAPKEPNRKLQQTVLDSFTKLTYDQQNIRVKSGIALVKHLSQKTGNNEKNEFELNYSLKRLIRGLGSPRATARSGFFAAVVAAFSVIPEIGLDQVLKIVDTELVTSSSNSKSEKGEIYLGRVLVCGAVIKSGLWMRGSREEKGKVVAMLVECGKKRTYLSLPAVTLLNILVETLEVRDFRTIVLPEISAELTKPLTDYTIDNLYLLILLKRKYPDVINGKFLKSCVSSSDLLSEKNLKALCDILITPTITSLKHPVYSSFAEEINNSPNVQVFLNELGDTLSKPHRNKHTLAALLLKHIANHSNDSSIIPKLLTENFVKQTFFHFKTKKDDDLQKQTHEFFSAVIEALKKDGVDSSTKLAVLQRILFDPGSLAFEKLTHSKLSQQITAHLDAENVKKLASIYREIVSSETQRNCDRLSAAQLLVKLLGHNSVSGEIEWRIEQLEFLMELSLVREGNVGTELATSLKSTFYRALDNRVPKLDDLRQLLSKLFHRLHSLMTPDNLETAFRSPVSTTAYETWLKTAQLIDSLEKKEKKKQKRVRAVFHTLFLQMALQLFNDTKLATDSLEELFKCYEKVETNKKDDNTEADPFWVEVITDLFLNLLSQNLHLLRSIISCVFPHLCEYMNATAMNQILAVLDPKNEGNPLSTEDESDDEEEESDSGDEEEEEEGEIETVSDKLRTAVREALGEYQTDEESVDVDDIDEEEGRKLDEALASAFKQFRPNTGKKNKKQNKQDETLTHFRIRALDLVEIYIESDPSMVLCLDIIVTLLNLLEFCIRDEHQKPLQDRVRSCLKKLTNLKKFSSIEDVTETVLGDLLRGLLEKGTKNAMIVQDMGDKIADCCIFVMRCSQLIRNAETTPKKVKKKLQQTMDEILLEELEKYFNNRDCLTPFALFSNVLQLNWEGNVSLVEKLIEFAFNEDVRMFRRNQAVELLRHFYLNHRFLSANKEEFDARCIDMHKVLSEKVIAVLAGDSKVNEKYVGKLFSLLCSIKNCPLDQTGIDWQNISENVREYRSRNAFSKDGKVAYKKLCNILGIPHLVQMKNFTSNKASDGSGNEDGNSKKRRKKSRGLDAKKLKKEAKMKRLQFSSEGLGDVSFSGASLDKVENENQENLDSGTGSFDENEAQEETEGNGVKRKVRESPSSGKKKKVKF